MQEDFYEKHIIHTKVTTQPDYYSSIYPETLTDSFMKHSWSSLVHLLVIIVALWFPLVIIYQFQANDCYVCARCMFYTVTVSILIHFRLSFFEYSQHFTKS